MCGAGASASAAARLAAPRGVQRQQRLCISHLLLAVCCCRGAEEERQAVRKRSRAALACVALATVALGALAARSAGHAPRAALAQSLAAGHARSATVARASKLWSGRTVPSSADAIAVSEADVDRLGLRAPPGFNVPSVNVTGDDVDRYARTRPRARAPLRASARCIAQKCGWKWAAGLRALPAPCARPHRPAAAPRLPGPLLAGWACARRPGSTCPAST